jgi:hypothetical protein
MVNSTSTSSLPTFSPTHCDGFETNIPTVKFFIIPMWIAFPMGSSNKRADISISNLWYSYFPVTAIVFPIFLLILHPEFSFLKDVYILTSAAFIRSYVIVRLFIYSVKLGLAK